MGPREHKHAKSETISISTYAGKGYDKVTMQIVPVCMQQGFVVKGVRRLAALKYGRIDHISVEMGVGKKNGQAMMCMPIKTASGKYNVVWLNKDDHEEDIESYSCCQMECYEKLLESHVDNLSDSPHEFEWWNAGA